MLPPENRPQNRREILTIRKKGTLFSSSSFGLLIFKKELPDSPRFAFIISTKIHQKSSKRNRVRRLLSEAIITLLPKIKPNISCLFLAKKTILNANLQDLKKELKTAFQKTNLLTIS
jgi:ribonuclease P protein component